MIISSATIGTAILFGDIAVGLDTLYMRRYPSTFLINLSIRSFLFAAQQDFTGTHVNICI